MFDIQPIHIPWITQGYEWFSVEGPKALNVEGLAKRVGKSKSSFYHHFANVEIFIDYVLVYHISTSKIIAKKEAACSTIDDLIEVLVEHKIDLLFNRQLRIHRENHKFLNCVLKTDQITIPGFLKVWAKLLDLEENSYLAGLVLKLSSENFYLQISEATLNRDWLRSYFRELSETIREFKKLGRNPILDGSV